MRRARCDRRLLGLDPAQHLALVARVGTVPASVLRRELQRDGYWVDCVTSVALPVQVGCAGDAPPAAALNLSDSRTCIASVFECLRVADRSSTAADIRTRRLERLHAMETLSAPLHGPVAGRHQGTSLETIPNGVGPHRFGQWPRYEEQGATSTRASSL